LAWSGLEQGTLLKRGSLVLIRPIAFTGYGWTAAGKEKVIGQIVGLPGEQLEIQNRVFAIDGQQLEISEYPVPQWLQQVGFSSKIPYNSYFISTRYNVRAYGLKLEASHVRQVCIFRAGDIEAKAFMRWWPLSRRGFIR